MNRRPMISIALAVMVPTLVFFGCARRPAVTAASIPAPIGASSSSAAALTGGAQPSASPRGGAGSTAASDRGTTPFAPGGSRPANVPPPSEFVPAKALADIHFDFDRADIRTADRQVLDDDAIWMKANAKTLILIEGHADERGTNEYNLALGERRAEATRNYLVAQGVASSRITLISYGEERPQCATHTESCWSRNRRAHFLVRPQ